MLLRTYWTGILVVVCMFIAVPVFAGSLHNAAKNGDIEQVKKLIAQGADVNAKGRHGLMALTIASEKGHVDVVKALLSKGADVNVKDSSGQTALLYAFEDSHREIVQLLEKAGAKE